MHINYTLNTEPYFFGIFQFSIIFVRKASSSIPPLGNSAEILKPRLHSYTNPRKQEDICASISVYGKNITPLLHCIRTELFRARRALDDWELFIFSRISQVLINQERWFRVVWVSKYFPMRATSSSGCYINSVIRTRPNPKSTNTWCVVQPARGICTRTLNVWISMHACIWKSNVRVVLDTGIKDETGYLLQRCNIIAELTVFLLFGE